MSTFTREQPAAAPPLVNPEIAFRELCNELENRARYNLRDSEGNSPVTFHEQEKHSVSAVIHSRLLGRPVVCCVTYNAKTALINVTLDGRHLESLETLEERTSLGEVQFWNGSHTFRPVLIVDMITTQLCSA